MKTFKFISMLAVATMGLYACSSADDSIPEKPSPIDTPRQMVSLAPTTASGNSLFSNGISLNAALTRAIGGDGQANSDSRQLMDLESKTEDKDITNGWNYGQTYIDFRSKAPQKDSERGEFTSKAEFEKVMKYINDHPNEGGVTFTYPDYYTQFVGCSDSVYTTTDNNNAKHTVSGKNHITEITLNDNHAIIQSYNVNQGNRVLVVNTPVTSASYKDSYSNNTVSDKYKFYLIDGNYYLCFDYAIDKSSSKEKYDGDGVYNDYVIKLIPAINEDPVEPEVKEVGGSVEVNLALNAPRVKDDYIFSHLSIHVRDTTDVTITLPVPATYTVASDDMEIVKTHFVGKFQINDNTAEDRVVSGSFETQNYTEQFAYTINGTTVKLKIQHTPDNIIVSTEGITKELLKYLRTTYNDGINFEVRTYFNNAKETTREALMGLLNQSTIAFANEPSVYVRANGYTTTTVEKTDAEGNKYTEHQVTTTVDPWACSVIPVQASLDLRTVPTDKVVSMNAESELWLYPLKNAGK